MYLKTLGRNLIWYKYSSNDSVWGSGMVCCNHISLPMLLIKAFVIISGKKKCKLLLNCSAFFSSFYCCQINKQSDFQIWKYSTFF